MLTSRTLFIHRWQSGSWGLLNKYEVTERGIFMNLDGKWLLTFDDEDWTINNFGEFDSKQDLLEYIKETGAVQLYDVWLEEKGEEPDESNKVTFYIGKVEDFVPGVNVDSILDDISENAYCHGGEYAEDYLCNVSREEAHELEDALNEVLTKWIKKYKHEPHFYQIVAIEEIEMELEKV